MEFKQLLKIVGKNIKELRENNKLSQKTFSIIISVDKSFFIKVENGKTNLSIGYLKKVAKGLKVPTSNLFKLKNKFTIKSVS